MTRLTARDREIITQARSLRGTPLMDGLRERTGNKDIMSAFTDGWGEAMHLLGELDAIIEREPDPGTPAVLLPEERAALAAARSRADHREPVPPYVVAALIAAIDRLTGHLPQAEDGTDG
jgi:hypothetical protein